MVQIIQKNGLDYLILDDGTKKVVRNAKFFDRLDSNINDKIRRMRAREAASCRYTSLGETIDLKTGKIVEKIEVRFYNLPSGGGYFDNGSSIVEILDVNRNTYRVNDGLTAVKVVGYRFPELAVRPGANIIYEAEFAEFIHPGEVEKRVMTTHLKEAFAQGVETRNRVYVHRNLSSNYELNDKKEEGSLKRFRLLDL